MSITPANVYDKLKTLNITLPAVATPAAAYVPFVQTGNLVFVSGHIAKKTARSSSASSAKTSARKKARRPPAPSPSI